MAAGDWKDLLKAVQEDDLTLVQYHINNGVNPNYQHPEFLTTPLIESIEYERLEIVRFLLENGADPELKAGFSADTPLKVAKRKKNKELIQLVRKYTKKTGFWQFFAK